MPVATRNGISIHFQEAGEGPPVVMLHGLLVGSLATWYFTAGPAVAASHRVVAYDLRGHGLSERAPSGYDMATMVADLGAVIDALGEPQVALVGHSFGAVVALEYTIRHPSRVAKLAVVEAPLPPSRLEELESFVAQSPDAMLDALPAVLKETVGRGGRQSKRFLDSMRFLATESTLFADLASMRDVPDEALAAIACPFLAVYGTRSSCRPVGRRLSRLVPGARLVEVEAGHFLPMEAPAPLGNVLKGFLDG